MKQMKLFDFYMIYLHCQVLQTQGLAGKLEDGSPVAAIMEVNMEHLQVLFECQHVGHQSGSIFVCPSKSMGGASNVDHPRVVLL